MLSITKYDPKYRDQNGLYTKDEWTSYVDIGKKYDGVTFSRSDYLLTEFRYLEAVERIATHMDIRSFFVRNFERYGAFRSKRFYSRYMGIKKSKCLKKYGLEITKGEKKFFNILENEEVSLFDALTIIKLELRDCIWCRLFGYSEKYEIELFFTCGFDYYMYVSCDDLPDELKEEIDKLGLFLYPKDNFFDD